MTNHKFIKNETTVLTGKYTELKEILANARHLQMLYIDCENNIDFTQKVVTRLSHNPNLHALTLKNAILDKHTLSEIMTSDLKYSLGTLNFVNCQFKDGRPDKSVFSDWKSLLYADLVYEHDNKSIEYDIKKDETRIYSGPDRYPLSVHSGFQRFQDASSSRWSLGALFQSDKILTQIDLDSAQKNGCSMF